MLRNSRLFVLVALVAMILWAGPAFCQEDPLGDGPSGALEMGTVEQPDFGNGYQVLVIPAAEFTPQGDVDYVYSGQGFIRRTGGSQDTFWAPVMLPAGSHISLCALYLYDTNPTQNITLTWGAYGFPLSGIPYYHQFLAVTKDTDVGYTYQLFAPGTVIRYYADLDNDGGTEAIGYRLTVRLTVTDDSLRFGAVELNWARTISPAPATATFDDVPVGSQGFQHVEALAASGITAGCDATHYCPNAPVTRLQMAIYLAKALGLHWQS